MVNFVYNGNSSKGGVYKITNNLNGRIYIGSSFKFKTRWNEHYRELKKGKHHNKFLQNDWNKCGEENFIFQIMDVIEGTKEDRLFVEQVYLDYYFDFGNLCYNHIKKAISFDRNQLKSRKRKYRKDAYWFISPEGIEEVVLNLSRFCKERDLDQSYMNKLGNNKIKQYKGWATKQIDTINDLIILYNKKLNIEEKVTSINDFMKKYYIKDTDRSSIFRLINGKLKSCKGWIVLGRNINKKKHKGKIYRLINPEGLLIKINNLEDFCRQNNLKVSSFRKFLNNKKSLSCKGYIKYGYTKEMVKELQDKASYDWRRKEVKLISPSGEIVLVKGLTRFAKENNLTKQCIIGLVNGKQSRHKGWKVYTSPV